MKRILLFVVAVMCVAIGYAQNTSPLCFTARNGSVTVRFDIKNVTHTIQYSINGGESGDRYMILRFAPYHVPVPRFTCDAWN